MTRYETLKILNSRVVKHTKYFLVFIAGWLVGQMVLKYELQSTNAMQVWGKQYICRPDMRLPPVINQK
jgi:hypothetical protein